MGGSSSLLLHLFLNCLLHFKLVIVFRISVTSSTLNGLVLVSQIRDAPSIICEIFSYIIRQVENTTSVLFLSWALILA